jgi:peptidyl-tRNA hydrolase
LISFAQPDKEIIEVTEMWLLEGLEMAVNAVQDLKPLLDGKRKPKSCGKCDYCKAHKQLKEIISLDDLIGG